MVMTEINAHSVDPHLITAALSESSPPRHPVQVTSCAGAPSPLQRHGYIFAQITFWIAGVIANLSKYSINIHEHWVPAGTLN